MSMAAKKKSTAKKPATKREKKAPKPKKVAAKAPKAPKAPKAAKAPKERKPKDKSSKDKPTTGQSGPAIELAKEDLNSKELRIVTVLSEDANPLPITALAAACFKEESAAKANSWIRNSLRRPVRGKWIEKMGRGTYRLTQTGKDRLAGIAPPPPPPAPAPEVVPAPTEAAAQASA
jgi:hypothetical protein